MTLSEALDSGIAHVVESTYYDPPRYFARVEDVSWEIGRTLFESRSGRPLSLRKNPAAPRAAIEMYARFQGHEPRKLGRFFSGFKIPLAVSYAGPAFNVMYRSDKNDPSTGKPVKKPIDYIHDHEKGVNVYRCDGKAGPADVAVPAFIRDVDALVLLGDCLGFTYEDENGDAIEAAPTNPIPELYTIPSGKALVVVQSKRKVLALIWGGKLGVEARGIVY